MIYVVYRDVYEHSGMGSFLAGLQEYGSSEVSVVSEQAACTISFKPRDVLLFNDGVKNRDDVLSAVRDSGYDGQIKVGQIVHSSMVQMDVSNELSYVLDLVMTGRGGQPLDLLLASDRLFTKYMQTLFPVLRSYWVPCLLADKELWLRHPLRDGCPHFQFWLPLTMADDREYYRHKNTFAQVAGVAMSSRRLNLNGRVFTTYSSDLLVKFAAFSGVNLEALGSLSKQDLSERFTQAAIGLNISIGDSFSYNTMELMLSGVPVLYSPTIPWAWPCKELTQYCGVTNPGDIPQISERIYSLFRSEGTYAHVSRLSRDIAVQTLDDHVNYMSGLIEAVQEQRFLATL